MSTIAHYTVDDYDRIISTGVFDAPQKRRVELIHGEIREMNPIGAPHEDVVDRLLAWSARSVSTAEVRIRVQNSIGFPRLGSVPEPDIAWVLQRSDYSRNRPTADDVLLLIEVAESSLAHDTTEKAELYAHAGIKDYWVVDVVARAIEVRRDPEGGRYRSMATFQGDEEICPLARPAVKLRPAELFEDV
jgi:Uma2 family endonuclease